MEKPEYCKNCKDNDFIFEERITLFNPVDDGESIIDSFTCTKCGCYHFEYDEFICFQFEGMSTKRKETAPKLSNHVNN